MRWGGEFPYIRDMDEITEVTQILSDIDRGDPVAAERLLPLVYEELRCLARARMALESSDQTLQPTALVHEAYLRMVNSKTPQDWNGRGHFFAAAAESMRRILIDRARKKKRIRHGGGRQKFDLELLDPTAAMDSEFLLALDPALEDLEREYPDCAQVVKLRFFTGFSIAETAEVTGSSVRTVNRQWAFARAWLYRWLSERDRLDAPANPVAE